MSESHEPHVGHINGTTVIQKYCKRKGNGRKKQYLKNSGGWTTRQDCDDIREFPTDARAQEFIDNGMRDPT